MTTIQLNQTLRSTYNILRITFTIVPVVAGLDKFFNLLTNWDLYVQPGMAGLLPFTPHMLMMIIGVIEIAAGIIVFTRPAIGGYVVAAWLTVIALTLLLG